jgi:hypothetical protein
VNVQLSFTIINRILQTDIKKMPCFLICSAIININVRIMFVWNKCLPVARPNTECDAEFLFSTVGYLLGLIWGLCEFNLDWSHVVEYCRPTSKELPCLVISSTIINNNIRILFIRNKCLPVLRPNTECVAEFLCYTVGYLLVLDVHCELLHLCSVHLSSTPHAVSIT